MVLDKCRRLAPVLIIAALGCSPVAHPHEASVPSAPPKPIAIATTSTLASLVTTVADGHLQVRSLVPVGASPETYEPSPQDFVALNEAAVVFENGSGLESWLSKLLANAKKAQVVVLSDALPRDVSHPGGEQFTNPHFWLDPHYAALYVDAIENALASVDPAHAAAYRSNAAAEKKKLRALDGWITREIATIPEGQRAMIADHDAWYYFDRRYGIEDVGAIERSPRREPSAADLAALIAQARAHHVRAIFAEPEFSPRLAKQLADSAGIATVTDLYDDSLGTTPELSTYDGMMRHDVNTIVQALR